MEEAANEQQTKAAGGRSQKAEDGSTRRSE
jgi:hypothetical protein